MDVVCVGDCGVDHYLPSGERRFGGITANFARHAISEFAPDDTIRIISCVGRDDGAALVNSSLQGSGIDCHVTQIDGSTPVQYIEIEANGEKRFVRYDEGVLREFCFSDEQVKLIEASDLLVAPVYLQIVGLFDKLMEIQTRGRISIDFADFLQHPDFELLDRHIEAIDVGFFGLTSADANAIGELAQRASQYEKLFVVTLGADGSRVFDGSTEYRLEALPVNKVVDTTGGGDAYAAGFLSHYCDGAGIQECMVRGASLAAQVISRVGSHE